MKQMVLAVIMLISSIFMFGAVVYAWFTLSNENTVQPVNASIIERNVDLLMEYGKNGGSYESFEQPADINAYLNSSLPGDEIALRLTVQNGNTLGTPDLNIEITLMNIRASVSDIEYDLTDFFFIESGLVTLTWYASSTDLALGNSYLVQQIGLDKLNETTVDYLGVPLNDYRFSNIFDTEMNGEELEIINNVGILESTPIGAGYLVVIEFTIGFDGYTPDFGTGFQDGELLIDGLYTLYD